MTPSDRTKRWLAKGDNLQRKRKQTRECMKKLREENPDKVRDTKLRCAYGITLQQYSTISLEQDGKCAICKSECPTGRRLAVDHDHSTKKVRGLLCANCNRGIGMFQESAERLIAAATYLKEHNNE